MVLEALKIYAVANTEAAMARVLLQTDDAGLPGDEIYSWEVDISSETHGNNYFLIITTDLCVYLDADNYYWLTLQAIDTESQITWIYSNNATFTYTSSSDQGENWEPAIIGNCGSLSIWAEYIYEPEVEETAGDINSDGSVNVLDVVILANAILSPEGKISPDSIALARITTSSTFTLPSLFISPAVSSTSGSYIYSAHIERDPQFPIIAGSQFSPWSLLLV
jgi:hypothetical protein